IQENVIEIGFTKRVNPLSTNAFSVDRFDLEPAGMQEIQEASIAEHPARPPHNGWRVSFVPVPHHQAHQRSEQPCTQAGASICVVPLRRTPYFLSVSFHEIRVTDCSL